MTQNTLFKIDQLGLKIQSMDVHFSSLTDNWSTPNDVFEYVDRKYGPFEVDVCASKENAKCDRYYTRQDNGLRQDWSGRCWMNPPYGREIGLWIQKAYQSSLDGALVACLIPSRTDTAWWHEYVMRGKVHFIRGRLNFGTAKRNAPFPSALVIFKHQESQEAVDGMD